MGPEAPETVTFTDCVAVPPAPVQASVNTFVAAVSAALCALPAVACEPFQAPLAVQAVASADDQVKVVVAPLATDVGFADSLSVGAGVLGVTLTVVD